MSRYPKPGDLGLFEGDFVAVLSAIGPCLLDCIEVNLTEVDVFSARRVPARGESFRIQRQEGKVLKEKGAAKLNIERNLYEDFCRDGEGGRGRGEWKDHTKDGGH